MARSGALLLLALVSAAGLLLFVDDRYAVGTWLAWPMLRIWAWQALLNLSWVCAGIALTLRVSPSGLYPLERLCVGVATGVIAFALSLYLLGALGLFRPEPATVLPFLFVAAGGPVTYQWWRRLPQANATDRRIQLTWLSLGIAMFGAVWTVALYLGVLSPDTVSYDARWMHLCIAQDYAREGRLVPFPGDWVKAYPHLFSVVQTWNFLVPGFSEPATRWMMALHTEFSLFLWTLVGVAAAARWMIAQGRTSGTWAAFFLFPGVFIYDGNLTASADHAVAFFALPAFILSLRVPAVPAARAYALWGFVAGGALITKYQALHFMIPLTVLMLALTVRANLERRPSFSAHLLRCAGWLVGGVALASGPHFLRNAVYHGNPVYPLLQQVFTGSHPTVRDAPAIVQYILADYAWRAPEELKPRIKEALQLIFTFPFKPHYSFLNNIPSFGFAFSAALPIMLVVRQNRRLWIGALVCLGAVFMWGFTYRVDRNLQVMLPLLVATSAAIYVRAWHSGTPARVGVAVLVAVQAIWATDLALSSSDRIDNAFALIASGREGQGETRFARYSSTYLALDDTLPDDAVVLLHHWHPQLGINRPIYLDWVGFQGSIDYRAFGNERQFYDHLRRLGVTHVVYLPGEQAAPSRQEDVIFNSFSLRYGRPKQRTDFFEWYELPAQPPPHRPPLKVLTIGVEGYADGQYAVTDLGTIHTMPPALQRFSRPRISVATAGYAGLSDTSDAVLVGATIPLEQTLNDNLMRRFRRAARYPGLTVYIRIP